MQFTQRVLSRIRWSKRDVADFLGRYLSAPKPQVVFEPRSARGALVRLDPKSQLLYYGTRFFMNGARLTAIHMSMTSVQATSTTTGASSGL